jgi:hypothetical protein
MEKTVEVWKKIKDTHYSASSKGRVRNDKTGTILKQYKQTQGYMQVQLDGTSHCVQRVVAYAFGLISSMEHIPGEIDIDHINNVRCDNRIENLQAISHAKNIKKRDSTGFGYKRPIACYTLDGDYVRSFSSIKEASDSLGLDMGNICHVLRGRYDHTGSYYFRYATK